MDARSAQVLVVSMARLVIEEASAVVFTSTASSTVGACAVTPEASGGLAARVVRGARLEAVAVLVLVRMPLGAVAVIARRAVPSVMVVFMVSMAMVSRVAMVRAAKAGGSRAGG